MKPLTRRAAGMLPAVLLFVAAAPLSAQTDTIVRVASTWQRDVDRLTNELLQQRRIEAEFRNLLAGLQLRLRSEASDSVRMQYQFVTAQLKEAGSNQIRIRRSIESLCSSVRKPKGWLGIVTTGYAVYDMQDDGDQIVRYLEPPVVASVDPGSPAERAGLQSGDVLVEIGGQPMVRNNVVFAEILTPGEVVAVKVQRGQQVVVARPRVESVPAVLDGTPCSWLDAGTAYLLAPAPGEAAFQFEVRTDSAAPRRFLAPRAGVRTDSSRTGSVIVGGSFAGPMAQFFTGGVNPVAGVQLVPMNPDLGKLSGAETGLFVVQVLQGTPGRDAGLRGGDVILSADGVELRSAAMLSQVIRRSEKRAVMLVVLRDRKQEKVSLVW
jgi:C-terminal processing protease CtpA/Prc